MTDSQRTNRRGQTTLDFAIAMGVFLLTVAFVFTFIPSLTAPFVDGNQDRTAIADRVATNLVEGALADPDEPYVLDVTCTSGFFNETNISAIDHCGYTNDTADFRKRIGVSDRSNVNVTLVRINRSSRERRLQCGDGSGTVVNATDPGCNPDLVYELGENPTGGESVTVARRVVSIDEKDATLFVRVW